MNKNDNIIIHAPTKKLFQKTIKYLKSKVTCRINERDYFGPKTAIRYHHNYYTCGTIEYFEKYWRIYNITHFFNAKRFWEIYDYFGDKWGVLCKTQEEFNRVNNFLGNIFFNSCYNSYKENTCILPGEMLYGDIFYCNEHSYYIIPSTEYKPETMKTNTAKKTTVKKTAPKKTAQKKVVANLTDLNKVKEDIIKGIEDKKAELNNLTAELEKIEKKIKESEFKVGDYVLAFDKIGQIKDINGLVEALVDDSRTIPFWVGLNHLKHATIDEIKEYLLKDAEKRGYKVGVEVENPFNCTKGVISFLKIRFRFAQINSVRDYKKEYFIWATYQSQNFSFQAPIDQLKLYNPISIVVNGVKYNAEFKKGYVKFGCAEISNNLIRDALHSIGLKYHMGNRNIEGIKIGKGLFTKELLTKLVEKLVY